MYLHRHSFEITNIFGKHTSGFARDIAMLSGFQEMEVV